MNTARQAVLRWASKIVATIAAPTPRNSVRAVKALDTEQLRQVVGGDGAPQSPKGNW